jgi:spoIIIJ-associated protein
VSHRDNAVAEPSGPAGEQDAWEQGAGQEPEATAAGSVASDPGDSGSQDAARLEPAAGVAAATVAGTEFGVAADRASEPGTDLGRDDDAHETGAELRDATDAEVGGDATDAEFSGDDDADEDDAEFGGGDAGPQGGDGAGRSDVADLELEGEIAADYVEGLLDVADLDGDIDMDVEGDRALVSVVGATLDELVGPRGEVLEALQELTRLAVHRQTGARTRVMLDVGGYRQRRRAELAETGREAAEEVRRTGEPKRLWAMNRFERKVVHDAVAAAGLQSESEGEEPDRKVVVLPAD